jgi:glutamate transport system permease protein
MDAIRDNWREVLTAFGVTIEMSVLAAIIALVVGFVLAALRVSPIPVGRGIGAAYVQLVRNTPLLLIMLIVAFGLPELDLRPELNLNSWFGLETRHALLSFDVFFIFATVALGLYTASFVCEAVRSGINSIPLGQAEAARSVGMTFGQTLLQVVLPQAYRAVIPPLTSTMIAMTKNSSVAAGVGVTEATFQMRKLTNDHADQILAIFIGFAIGYMVLVALISAAGNLLERRAAVS